MVRTLDPEKQRDILKAARKLLVEQGLEGFSIRKVARAAGISSGGLYSYYDGKDALLSATLNEGAQRFSSYLVDALGEKTSRDRLRAMGHRYFDFAREHWEDYRLLFQINCEDLGFQQVEERASEESESSFQLLVDRIVECQSDEIVQAGDPTNHATFVWSSVHGLATLFMNGQLQVDESTFDELVEKQLDYILGALEP